ncbi:MAG: carboxypeptidase regulatory-like domain-containing protein [Bryobacteraceae bacterium]|jgi:tetratricopeptide (TPR) repeat protein
MSFRLKSLLFAACAFLFVSLPAFSQVTAVEGVVKDSDGKPVVGAIVTFERSDIKGHYTVKTDKKGHYGHYGLPMGTYVITCTIDGQVRDTASNYRTTPGDTKTLNFDLKQSAAQQAALAQAAASGTLTEEQARGMTKEQKEAFEKNAKAREAQLAKNKALNDAYTAGKNAIDAKQWDAAVENLNKAAELDATQPAVWTSLADAYVGKAQATPPEAAANYDKAFDAFKKAIELKPDAGLYNNYALALAKDKKLDEASANLAKAVELDPPGAGKYYYNLGALLVNSGQGEAATENFRKSIAADPTYADAHFQLGMSLAAKAGADPKTGAVTPVPGTIEELQKYLELKPDGVNAQSAKEMIAALGGSVATTFQNPSAKGKKK